MVFCVSVSSLGVSVVLCVGVICVSVVLSGSSPLYVVSSLCALVVPLCVSVVLSILCQ